MKQLIYNSVVMIMLVVMFAAAPPSAGSALEEKQLAQAVSTDLRLLPKPIYQPELTLPGAAALVLPDAPSVDEMKAALIVAAGFGRMSNGELALSFMTAGQVSLPTATGKDLIFVGKPFGFAILAQAALPARASSTGYALAEMEPDDGILQMAISPWDGTRVVLVVGGNTDTGVVKAAQALSTGNIQTGSNTSLAIVAGVHLAGLNGGSGGGAVPSPTDRTFHDLGYMNKFVSDHSSRVDYWFDIPPAYTVKEDAYLDLVYGNTPSLNYTESNLEVYLNDHYIGTARFSDGTMNAGTERFIIPSSFLVNGSNSITILISLTPIAGVEQATVGARIESGSLLHLPLQPVTISPSELQALGNYPYPFINDPALASVAFILPQQNTIAWEIATRLAFNLGRSASTEPFNLAAAYDRKIPEEVRQGRDLIIIGLPSDLTIITELAQVLPAPFEPGSNEAILTNMPVVYRLPAGMDLGYLELFKAPWNGSHTVLAVLGNGVNGVQKAADALINPALRAKITGDFALVNGENISSTDTRNDTTVESVISGTVTSPATPTVSVFPYPTQPESTGSTSRDWLPVMIIGLIMLMAIILIISVITGLNRRKTSI